MQEIHINEDIWLSVGHPKGIYINCCPSDPDNPSKVLDVFNVSLFFSSVKALLESLSNDEEWENKDRSLSVTSMVGDDKRIRFAFKMQGPPFEDADYVLNGEDSKKFIEELSKITDR